MNYMMETLISSFIVLWAAIDPVGTVPVFIAVTKNYSETEKRKIAYYASFVAILVLGFFLVMGQFILDKMGVPLPAFQISGGIILFLFATDMIFGDSKPESEMALAKSGDYCSCYDICCFYKFFNYESKWSYFKISWCGRRHIN